MTARHSRRRRRTIVGAAIGVTLLLIGAGLTVVGANTIANSTAGEVVQADDRPVVALPPTDNAALAVIDGQGTLTSLIVATMLPSGRGGSIVTVPVAADVNAGLGESFLPLTAVIDTENPQLFFEQVEATLAITLQFGEIVGGDRLTELLDPTLPAEVELPIDVVDSDAVDDRLVIEAGRQRLDAPLLVRMLMAVELEASERAQHSIDVAVWSGIARAAPAATGTTDGETIVPVDESGRPVPSSTIEEFFERFWAGPVQVRDLAVDELRPGNDAVITGKSVVIDRRDAVLVFAQTSPARVSAPNPGPVFRIVIPINDDQLEASGSSLTSRRNLAVNLVGLLLFLEANVGSVDATPAADGASEVTRVEVADPDYVPTMEELGPQIFGDVEVVVADELVDGIDVVVVLGTGYFEIESTATVTTVSELGEPTDDGAATVETDG